LSYISPSLLLTDEASQIQGPVDGSLYATILKSPRSPTSSNFQLISPPAEFSNGKSILDKPRTPNPSDKYYNNSYSSAKNLTSFKSVNRENSATEAHYAIVENGTSDVRESVRSPLTLSMDSGISSSGVVNRELPQPRQMASKLINLFLAGRHQGSSASPSSFPSQASPQGILCFHCIWSLLYATYVPRQNAVESSIAAVFLSSYFCLSVYV
jgi:hypothetical protein